MDIDIDQIAKATGAKVLSGEANLSFKPSAVSTDTRTVSRGDIFFALIGEKYDAHDFLEEAFQKGATSFVISKKESASAELLKKATVLLVDDTLRAYGDAAKFYRSKFRIPSICVTGSCGKTTVKEILAHVLSTKMKVLKNRGTENNLVGVPKTLFQLDASHEVMVLELGTNQPGEIQRLSTIAAPQMGVVTHIGYSHLQGLKDLEGVKNEKLKILSGIERGGSLIVNGQDSMLRDVQSGMHRVYRAGNCKEGNDISASQIWCHDKGTSFYVDKFLNENTDTPVLFETELLGKHNAINCLYAIFVAASMGMEIGDIQKAIATFKPVAGRLNIKKLQDIIFIDDTYNSNPTSFKAALELLKDFKIREKKIVVCGDMLELGDQSEIMHRKIGKLISELLFDYVIAAGTESRFLVDEALKNGFDSSRIFLTENSEQAGKLCKKLASKSDMVLLKGSRATQMEKVLTFFA